MARWRARRPAWRSACGVSCNTGVTPAPGRRPRHATAAGGRVSCAPCSSALACPGFALLIWHAAAPTHPPRRPCAVGTLPSAIKAAAALAAVSAMVDASGGRLVGTGLVDDGATPPRKVRPCNERTMKGILLL